MKVPLTDKLALVFLKLLLRIRCSEVLNKLEKENIHQPHLLSDMNGGGSIIWKQGWTALVKLSACEKEPTLNK